MKHAAISPRVPRCVGARLGHQQGLTLVELMVAMVIGLVVTLAVTVSVLTMGRQFKVVGSNAAAQTNAQIALSLMDEAGRTAGAGLFNNGQILCPTLNAWSDGVLRSNGAVFMPARITDGGGNTASDSLVFTASTAAGALSGTPVMVDMATADDSIVVSNAGALVDGDLALVGAPGTNQPCTLFQVNGAPAVGAVCGGNATSCKTLTRTGNASTGFNPMSPAATFTTAPRYGFSATGPIVGPAVVNRLGGELRQTAFSVNCGALIQFNAFSDVPTCTQSPLSFAGGANALATDVVLVHAQYGISVVATSDIVTNWVHATGGTWANPSATDVARIKAVRVVVVVRSKEAEPAPVTTVDCTNNAAVVNVGPCSFQDAEAPVIDLSATSVPAGRTWRHYRYRVHQAVIPLRNVIWSL